MQETNYSCKWVERQRSSNRLTTDEVVHGGPSLFISRMDGWMDGQKEEEEEEELSWARGAP
jgi:hypothetical protein